MIATVVLVPRQVTWRTAVALAVVAVAAALDWWWVWGVWMCYYAIVGIRSDEAFLVEPVPRRTHPVSFWTVTVMWAGFGIWTAAADLWPWGERGTW